MIIALSSALTLLMFGQEKPFFNQQGIEETGKASVVFSDNIEFSQDTLMMEHAARQYRIIFHEDAIINVSLQMLNRYTDNTVTSEYLLLTNGTSYVLPARYLVYYPERTVSITTPRRTFSIGRHWLMSFLDKRNIITFGLYWSEKKEFQVTKGTSWYLTLAIPSTLSRGNLSIRFLADSKSMEVIDLGITNNVGVLSSNQLGRYFGVKIASFGCSFCNIEKEVTTRNGSIIIFDIAGHRKGTMNVIKPDGEVFHSKNPKIMVYSYIGNETGTWKFTLKAHSFLFKVIVSLIYIDVNPYVKSTPGIRVPAPTDFHGMLDVQEPSLDNQ